MSEAQERSLRAEAGGVQALTLAPSPGDFEMIRVLVSAYSTVASALVVSKANTPLPDAMNEGNPGLNLGEEAVDSIEGAFKRLRHMMLGASGLVGALCDC